MSEESAKKLLIALLKKPKWYEWIIGGIWIVIIFILLSFTYGGLIECEYTAAIYGGIFLIIFLAGGLLIGTLTHRKPKRK